MIIIKDNYYLYIENLRDINVNTLKTKKKINIILRNPKINELNKIISFRKKCKEKRINFFIANNENISKICKADGLYISSYNKKKYFLNIKKIGSAHNFKEIKEKNYQGCEVIIFSRLFQTKYKDKKSQLGIIKFNLINQNSYKKLIPLGGINHHNLLSLNMVTCKGLASLSGVKKKPAIFSRLF